jgi:signal transduction histidine kinase/ActR/RegA family two-component response regulator
LLAADVTEPEPVPATDARVEALVLHDHRRLCAQTDRVFAFLLLAQWLFSIVLAVAISPLTWAGGQAAVHPHVWIAVVVGGLVCALPAYLALAAPGQPLTRHVVAVGQMAIGGLLIHLTGGRIETHFHIFGSLAFLSAYRDPKVLGTATVVMLVDHFARGVFFPASIFGAMAASAWRPLEHAAWVIFEVVVLYLHCVRAAAVARDMAVRQVTVEDLKATIEARVERRTAQLQQSRAEVELVNAELRAASARAEESSRSKSAFLATVSHEVRTPMNGIIGVAELLRDTGLSQEQGEYVEIIERSGYSLLGIINDILDFSKLEAGKLEVESIAFDLLDQIDHVLAVVAHKAEAKQLALGAVVAADVPRRVIGDAGRLNQVLINLLGNAVKFTDTGRVVLRVTRADLATGPGLRLDVQDTGIGLSADALARLFQPFTQADATTTRRFGGTGLGLAISRTLAEALGGTLTVESAIGEGSTFSLRLPLIGAIDAAPTITCLPPLPVGRALVLASTDTGGNLVAEQLAAWGLESDVTTDETQVDGRYAVIIGYDLDPTLSARLPQSRADRLCALVRAPLTPRRFCADLSGTTTTDPADRSRARLPTPAAVPAGRDGQRHVLVVEDNPINQRVAEKMLARLGYRVDTANHGYEAIARMARTRYDIVLMDCQMPEMDGFEATQRLRAMEARLARTPIVALTANAMPADRERCLAAGMDDFLSKPLTVKGLEAMLARYVALADARQADGQSQASVAPV